MDLILPDHHWILWKTSWYSLVSALFAASLGKFDLAIGPMAIFLTSINYWYHPDYSWRRYLDMAVVTTALTYHLYRAYFAENGLVYYVLIVIALSCFQIGQYYYSNKKEWESTVSHAGLHVIGNIANIILYSGLTP